MKKQPFYQHVALFLLALLIVNGCDKSETTIDPEENFVGSTKSLTLNLGPDWTMNPTSGHYYRFTDQMPVLDAEDQALRWGGHLVTLNDREEELWIKSIFGTTEHLWIGLNDINDEGNMVWFSGEPVTYTNWDDGEPNNYCGCSEFCEDAVIMNWGSGAGGEKITDADSWNDIVITNSYRGIVEKIIIKVSIDIKPGSDPNSINIESEGVISVAILTCPEFDAASVNPNTVTMGNGDGSDTPVAKKNDNLMANIEDVDNDGDLDLVLHFKTQALVENGDLYRFTTGLILT